MFRTYILFGAAIMLAACREKSKVDVAPPQIASVTIDTEDSSVVQVLAGEEITITVAVTDDMGLNQLQYNIHPAENGHSHNGTGHIGAEDRINSGSWYSDDLYNISGTSFSKDIILTVPDSAAGNWHLAVNAMDEFGNAAIEHVVLLEVVNDNLPVITINSIPPMDINGQIEMAEGTILTLNGQAVDLDGLAEFFIHMDSWNGIADDTTFIQIAGNGTLQTFENLTFDSAVSGDFRLVAEARDSLGFVRKWDARIHVTD